MPIFEIDPDVRKAKTLADEFYTDPSYFDLVKEKIFVRSWHFLGQANYTGSKPQPSFQWFSLDGVEDFPCESDDLKHLASAVRQGFTFA